MHTSHFHQHYFENVGTRLESNTQTGVNHRAGDVAARVTRNARNTDPDKSDSSCEMP